jgi:hypothetical protein
VGTEQKATEQKATEQKATEQKAIPSECPQKRKPSNKCPKEGTTPKNCDWYNTDSGICWYSPLEKVTKKPGRFGRGDH